MKEVRRQFFNPLVMKDFKSQPFSSIPLSLSLALVAWSCKTTVYRARGCSCGISCERVDLCRRDSNTIGWLAAEPVMVMPKSKNAHDRVFHQEVHKQSILKVSRT